MGHYEISALRWSSRQRICRWNFKELNGPLSLTVSRQSDGTSRSRHRWHRLASYNPRLHLNYAPNGVVYRVNNIGPNIDPLGTPEHRSRWNDRVLLKKNQIVSAGSNKIWTSPMQHLWYTTHAVGAAVQNDLWYQTQRPTQQDEDRSPLCVNCHKQIFLYFG